MKILLFSASGFGYRCLEMLATMLEMDVVGIITTAEEEITLREQKLRNIHAVSFDKIAEKLKIPLLKISGIMDNQYNSIWIKNKNADLGLAIGWYLKIPPSILQIPKYGIAGIHASLLPLYRGGAPLVWAMIQGEKETGASLFYLCDTMDEGDILAQTCFKIGDNDYIADVYSRMESSSMTMLHGTLCLMDSGKLIARKQKVLPAKEYQAWPMRTAEDGQIDWCRPADKIYDFIRAQSRPYPGAYTIFEGRKVYIWRSRVLKGGRRKDLPGTVCGIIDTGNSSQLVIAAGEESTLIAEELTVQAMEDSGVIIPEIVSGSHFSSQLRSDILKDKNR